MSGWMQFLRSTGEMHAKYEIAGDHYFRSPVLCLQFRARDGGNADCLTAAVDTDHYTETTIGEFVLSSKLGTSTEPMGMLPSFKPACASEMAACRDISTIAPLCQLASTR